MKKNKNIIIYIFIMFFVFENTSFCKENRYVIKSKNKFNTFVKNYILTDKNQIFADNLHMLSVSLLYGQDKIGQSALYMEKVYLDLYYSTSEVKRNYGQFALNYSLPTRFWFFNGRFSLSIFTFLFKQNIDVSKGYFLNHTMGFDLVQELIFGHPNLYFTVGLGVSYQRILLVSKVKTNYYFNDSSLKNAQTLPNNSLFNFVVKLSIGHRFNNGLITEFLWKHYSNGSLCQQNWGINTIGINIGYAFG